MTTVITAVTASLCVLLVVSSVRGLLRVRAGGERRRAAMGAAASAFGCLVLGLGGTAAGLAQSFAAVGQAPAESKASFLTAGISTATRATAIGMVASMIAGAALVGIVLAPAPRLDPDPGPEDDAAPDA